MTDIHEACDHDLSEHTDSGCMYGWTWGDGGTEGCGCPSSREEILNDRAVLAQHPFDLIVKKVAE